MDMDMNVGQNQGYALKTKLLIKDKEYTLDYDFSENAPMQHMAKCAKCDFVNLGFLIDNSIRPGIRGG